MVRQPCWNKTWLKKGTWSHDEDQKLTAYIMRYGIWNWNEMAKYAGLARSGKSCRLRWMNYLRPNIRRGNFNREEEETIIRLQNMLGNRWSAIAARLPQRTDNDIKNYWNTCLKKRVAKNNSPSATTTSSTNEIISGGIETGQENSSDVTGSPMFLDTLFDLDSPVPTLDDFPEPTTSWNHQLPPLTLAALDNEECQEMSGNSQLWLHEPIYLSDSYYDPVDDFWVSPYIYTAI